MAVKKRKYILAQHEKKFAIKEMIDNKKGVKRVRWRTFLPNEKGMRGKPVVKSNRSDLEDIIVEYYLQREKECTLTFEKVYTAWKEDYFLRNSLSDNTKDKYITDYERFLKGSAIESMPITDITDEDIDQLFLEKIKSTKGRKDQPGIDYKSFGKLYGYLEGTFRYAYKKHMIQENPMGRLEKKDYRNICREPEEKTAETELISDECFDQILKQLYEDMKDNPTYFATYAVELSAKLGTRVGEIATLKWKDVDYRAGYITIRRSDRYRKYRDESGKIIKTEWVVEERTKTKKQRRFPIDDEIQKSLDRIWEVQKKYGLSSEWVFPHPEYGWTHSSIVSSCLKNKCKQLGFDRTYVMYIYTRSETHNEHEINMECTSVFIEACDQDAVKRKERFNIHARPTLIGSDHFTSGIRGYMGSCWELYPRIRDNALIEAQTLVSADQIIREMFPGYCLIQKKLLDIQTQDYYTSYGAYDHITFHGIKQ